MSEPDGKRVDSEVTPTVTGAFERAYPTLAAWVREDWVEIGRVEGGDSFVAALDEGGLVWEGRPSPPSLDDALAAMEQGLARWLTRSAGAKPPSTDPLGSACCPAGSVVMAMTLRVRPVGLALELRPRVQMV